MSTEIVIQVECYAGYKGEERPLRFRLGQRTIEVKQIIDQWYGPDYRYFKLQGDDGDFYILRQDEIKDNWELTLFTAGSREETKLSSS